MTMIRLCFLCFFLLGNIGCNSNAEDTAITDETPIVKDSTPVAYADETPKELLVGAERTEEYLKLLQGKNVGLVVNQTSRIGTQHLVDSLISLGVTVKRIFAPEHGFRGTADAGEQVKDGKDPRTGVSVVSLYGKKKKPGAAELNGLDVVIFDIQDVGARFYTYISTMTYVMEGCAENGVSVLVLDRPNPNGHYVDGPVLEKGYSSFVGLHEIPVVHGMTVAEYARMVNEEGWLKGDIKCNLSYIPCANYDHTTFYSLPVKPSPNLPNMRSIYLYPSLCLFEGTTVNIGRGTETQFQVYGHPDYTNGDYSYTPISRPGAKYPKFKNQQCSGHSLTDLTDAELQEKANFDLSYLIDFYTNMPSKKGFFLSNNFFNKLAGNSTLKAQITRGTHIDEIRASWQSDIDEFKAIRKKYLLYTDFE